MKKTILAVVLAVAALGANALTNCKPNPMDNVKLEPGDALVEVKTSKGDVTLRLYGDTPNHRDNFLKLVDENFYDGVLFHRVIKDFMVQTGDPDSKTARPGQMLGAGGPDYTVPAEFVYPKHFHKKGALAAAREGDQTNPEKASSSCQFYVVTGKVFTPSELDQMEAGMRQRQKQDIFNRLARENRDSVMTLRRNRDQAGLQALQDTLIARTEAEAKAHPATFTAEQREAYSNIGGTPHLDGAYTVFGEVVDGMDVIDAIQQVATDRNDRPREDVKIISVTRK